MSALDSLRQASLHNSDIKQVISRYQDFIKRQTDPKVLSEANKDLQMWQDRQTRGLVRLGDKWMTTDERDATEKSAQEKSLPARDLILQARYKDAVAILQQALKDDPDSPTALYLLGLCQFAQGQAAPARKSFEAIIAELPGHGPTLNNLAVILWKTKSFGGALSTYQKAMTANPVNKDILDNVAEALHGVPDQLKIGPIYPPVAAMFRKQDTELQAQGAEQGFYRWGSAWVTARQLETLKAAQAKIDDQVKALGDQWTADEAKIKQMDQQISDDTRQMNFLQSQAVGNNAQGQAVQLTPPPLYYQLNGDITSMKTEQESLKKDEEKLKAQALEVKQSIPAAQYNGAPQMMGPDFAPVGQWASAGAAPSSRPVFQSTFKDSAMRPSEHHENAPGSDKPAPPANLPNEFR
jgi:tetratricopeptide (TPR) repeat protein